MFSLCVFIVPIIVNGVIYVKHAQRVAIYYTMGTVRGDFQQIPDGTKFFFKYVFRGTDESSFSAYKNTLSDTLAWKRFTIVCNIDAGNLQNI